MYIKFQYLCMPKTRTKYGVHADFHCETDVYFIRLAVHNKASKKETATRKAIHIHFFT